MTAGILPEGMGLTAVKEWRITYRSNDCQGGWWKHKPEIFTDYAEALRKYRSLCGRSGIKDVTFTDTIVVTVQELVR